MPNKLEITIEQHRNHIFLEIMDKPHNTEKILQSFQVKLGGYSVCLNISSYNLGNTSNQQFSERVESMRHIPIQIFISAVKNPEFLVIFADGTFQTQQRSIQ